MPALLCCCLLAAPVYSQSYHYPYAAPLSDADENAAEAPVYEKSVAQSHGLESFHAAPPKRASRSVPLAATALIAEKTDVNTRTGPEIIAFSSGDYEFASRPSPYAVRTAHIPAGSAVVAAVVPATEHPVTAAAAPEAFTPLPWKIAKASPVVPDANAIFAAHAAERLPVAGASRMGHEQQAIIVAKEELASMMFVSRQSVQMISTQASAEAIGIQLAYDTTVKSVTPENLSTLAPAAGDTLPSIPDSSVTPAPVAVQEHIPVPGGSLSSAPVVVEHNVIVTPSAPLVAEGPAPVPGGSITPVPTMTPVHNHKIAYPAPAEVLDLPGTSHAVPDAPMPPLPADPGIGLSAQSKAIVNRLPPERKKTMQNKAPIKVEHEQKNPLENDEVRRHEGVGISISVRQPKPNVSHMLEEAYDALIVGNQEDAIALYKEVLDDEPDNRLALFGLATTYHRAGQLKLARPLYGRLLALYPNDAEGLNNFLVLLADESPTEALTEMRRLEQTHPDFSPLPAQMAVIYEKLGDYDSAILSMKHAIELSPENIKYRYDMAVMFDKNGDWEEAALFYQQLLLADERGEKIPAKPEEIQERLTFIRSNKPQPSVVPFTKDNGEGSTIKAAADDIHGSH